MIQSILFFSLGFLSAGFLALMIAPAIWRRAVALTRKRIEASVPLSLSEIQADKDRMRAEFAMSTRRLEMSIKQSREKIAAQVVEINRNREELKQVATDRSAKSLSIGELETRSNALRSELATREGELQKLTQNLTDTERLLDERSLEIQKLGRMYEDASLSSSNKQIELVVRETEVDRLQNDLNSLRAHRKEAEQHTREVMTENNALREAAKAAETKAVDLEKKLERMLTTLTDREEKLERREKEVERLRETTKESSATGDDLKERLSQTQKENTRLQAELAAAQTLATEADVARAMAKLEADRDKLERRLTTLTRENKKLRVELSRGDPAKYENGDEERSDNAVLREQIHELAAEVVKLTASLDGPESPINQVLSKPAGPESASSSEIISLADRIRALQNGSPQAS